MTGIYYYLNVDEFSFIFSVKLITTYMMILHVFNFLCLLYSLESTANGDVRPHMTPRRVKRRSYTRSSARSAGKALKKELHTRQSGRSVRSASGALGTSGRPNKSINPVTRLMQETETHPTNDSSTSNEDPTTAKHTVERYGQVNPGYVGQVNPGYVSSRPNSLYR